MTETTKSADGALTVADLERMWEAIQTPPWLTMIREARVVDVKPSPHVPAGEAFTMDVGEATAFRHLGERRINPHDRGRVLVVCHPDDHPTIAKCVAELRGGES